MKLHAGPRAVLGLQEARRAVTVEVDLGVGIVVADQDVVRPAEGGQPLEEIRRGRGRGRIVRIVHVHQAHAGEILSVEGREVWEPTGLGRQGIVAGNAARQDRASLVGRIPRVRAQDLVPRVHERQMDVADALLGSDQREDLALGIEDDSEAVPVPIGEGSAQLRHAAKGGVMMIRPRLPSRRGPPRGCGAGWENRGRPRRGRSRPALG